jgi:hypothetical protein
MKEKTLKLSQKEVSGLQEDNERINRMYQVMQKEAFSGIDKLKKNQPTDPIANKKGYQPLRNENNKMPPSYQALVSDNKPANQNK